MKGANKKSKKGVKKIVEVLGNVVAKGGHLLSQESSQVEGTNQTSLVNNAFIRAATAAARESENYSHEKPSLNLVNEDLFMQHNLVLNLHDG